DRAIQVWDRLLVVGRSSNHGASPRGLRIGLRPILGRFVGSAKARRFRPPAHEKPNGAGVQHEARVEWPRVVEPHSFESFVGATRTKTPLNRAALVCWRPHGDSCYRRERAIT